MRFQCRTNACHFSYAVLRATFAWPLPPSQRLRLSLLPPRLRQSLLLLLSMHVRPCKPQEPRESLP